MNILVFFIAGVSIGLATEKLYHALFVGRATTEGSAKGQAQEVHQEAGVKASSVSTQKTAAMGTVTSLKQAEKRSDKAESITDEGPEDLRQIKGVGPKLEKALHEMGVSRYQQLASMSADELVVRLRENGGAFNKKLIASVIEQAGSMNDQNKEG